MNSLRLATASLAAMVFFILTTTLAFAQAPGNATPYAPPPPPGPPPGAATPGYYPGMPPGPMVQVPQFRERRGLTLGFGFGVGDMSADSGPIECFDCEYDPIAAGFDFHIGAMLNPRLALVFEVWGTGKTLDADGLNTLWQSSALVAAQYWVTPRVWVKGGVGVSHLSVTYDDGFAVEDEPVAEGGAVMGAVGYEIVGNHRFSVDLQLRLGSAVYEGIDEQIHSGGLGVGFNWF